MTPRIPEGKSRLMLVEGKEDQEFFIRLATHMNVIDGWPLHIEQLEGKGNFSEYLRGMMRHPRFGQLSTIGIVRDADFGTNAFQSVKDTIQNANERNPRQLPVPQNQRELAKGQPNIIVLILPSSEREGMIEDLIMDVFREDPVNVCVDVFFNCLRESEIAISQEKHSKARLRTFITGKNVGSDSEGGDSDRQYLSDVFRMSWWRDEFWNSPTFTDAKAFLTQLLAD
ncbi:MAG: hypothetical protein OXE46_12480 [Chloroflexi bacterium]|nr:hypothetical protein [Chloroflexota bacterium]